MYFYRYNKIYNEMLNWIVNKLTQGFTCVGEKIYQGYNYVRNSLDFFLIETKPYSNMKIPQQLIKVLLVKYELREPMELLKLGSNQIMYTKYKYCTNIKTNVLL